MAAILDNDATVEANSLSTSFDPYGQLIKMLMPRALCIAIHDRMGVPLWLSDGYDGHDLLQLVEEALNAARAGIPDPNERDGFARDWDGDTAYVFILRDGHELLGTLALSCRDSSGGSRPFAVVHGLLRPAVQVLSRELGSQYLLGDLRRDLDEREGDLALLLNARSSNEEHGDSFEAVVQHCVQHLDCSFGALLIPDKKISVSHSISPSTKRSDAELLERNQRHLLAWTQVQRRPLVLNKAPPNSPFGALPYKILACPVRENGQEVVGVLILFKPISAIDFDTRQLRLVDLMARRIAYVMQTAYDSTTRLLTRHAFEQRALAVITSSGSGGTHCVAYADIDRLHVVNENQGMHVGDQVIARIAEAIRSHLTQDITASCISGDRFALFFANTSAESAQYFLEQLCRSVANTAFAYDGKSIELSLSFGVACVPNTKLPLSHAMAAAEVACKAAKDRGRGRVEIYQDADRSIIRRYEDVTLVGDLREAIEQDRFRMEAQPIVAMGKSANPRRFELLLRMIDLNGENVSPDKFLSAAERYQLATDIDRWVVQYALEILSSAAPALEKLGAHFAINISGQSLGDTDFPDFLESKLREYALPPSLLSFEITETAAVANIVRAEMLIRRLQDLGHEIALDDFGRGLSSLTYLKSLPVSHLKIDGGLVRDLVGNQRSQAMVSAIVQLSEAMKLTTTAECVESEEILKTIGDLGVDFAQGFAIGRPRPLETVLQELLRGAPSGARNSVSPRMARLAGM
ncbi:MAG TPA: EAL domain-containing protein [Steroidobacteraceae bacterium]|nr:EAL domain-containing protein [Steroidobacteraceae bacterium]